MLVDTDKDNLKINQIIGQKTDNIIVEEDFVVPDIKPDILNAISTNGTICIYKKEVMDGKIKIDGCINAYVIYMADDEMGSCRSLNVNMNFSKIVDFKEAKQGMYLESEAYLKQIDCIVLNGRKVSIKGIIDINLKLYSNEEIEFVRSVNGIKNIQLLNESLNVNSLLGNGITKVYAKDTVMIDEVDNLVEIMKVNVDVNNIETKISYNKVLVKADTQVKMMYLTEDNKIKTVSDNIPTMGFIDIQNVSDQNICDVKYEIKNMLVKPNNVDEHSIYIEVEYETNCNVYEDKSINLIQDLYSPSVNLTYKQKKINAMSNKTNIKDIYSIREKQYIEEFDNCEIYDAVVNPVITNKSFFKDKIIFEGEVYLNLLYKNNNSLINNKQLIIPINYSMDAAGVSSNSLSNIKMDVIQKNIILMPDSSLDIKIDIEFNISTAMTRSINIIDELNYEENRKDDLYSVIIYIVKPGDTLWNIAKRFKSTIKDISILNDIEDENKIYAGEQLFIPLANY